MKSPRRREFGQPLVNSIYTFGLMVGVSVSDTTLGTLVANLGYDKLVFPAPVFVGDTLRCESEVHRRARVQVAPRRRDRHLGAPQLQPARRNGLRMHPLGADPQEAGMTLMPPRSWLFVPADSEKKIAKALDSDADAIIFDLEDSVAADRKAAARDILKALPPRAGGPRWWVRVNPLGSEHLKADLDLLALGRHRRHRPAQGRKRRRRHPARPPHRQHPDPRHRHRNRGQPVRAARATATPRPRSRR